MERREVSDSEGKDEAEAHGVGAASSKTRSMEHKTYTPSEKEKRRSRSTKRRMFQKDESQSLYREVGSRQPPLGICGVWMQRKESFRQENVFMLTTRSRKCKKKSNKVVSILMLLQFQTGTMWMWYAIAPHSMTSYIAPSSSLAQGSYRHSLSPN